MKCARKRKRGDWYSVLGRENCCRYLSLIIIIIFFAASPSSPAPRPAHLPCSPLSPAKDKTNNVCFLCPERGTDKKVESPMARAILIFSCSPVVFLSFPFWVFLFPPPKAERRKRHWALSRGLLPRLRKWLSQILFCQMSFEVYTVFTWKWLKLGCLFLNFDGSLAF